MPHKMKVASITILASCSGMVMTHVGRALTIQDEAMGMAMLTGEKRMETRKRKLAKGWYNLHVGKQSKSKASGAVVGRIYLGRVLSCSSLQDSWAMPEFGQFSSVIEKAIQFPAPIGKISGSQGVWYIKDQEILREIQTQQEIAQCNNFEPYRPDLPDLSMPNKRKSLFTPWTKRSPKKVYERKATHTAAAPQNRRMQKREQPQKRKWHPTSLHANQPASSPAPAVHGQEIAQSPRKRIKTLDPGERGTAMLSDSQRVTAGRTLPMLTKLMGVHLLGDLQRWNDNTLQPRPGLFGKFKYEDGWCFIVGSFSRRGVPMADVVPLRLG